MKLRDILSRHICLAGMVLLGNGPFCGLLVWIKKIISRILILCFSLTLLCQDHALGQLCFDYVENEPAHFPSTWLCGAICVGGSRDKLPTAGAECLTGSGCAGGSSMNVLYDGSDPSVLSNQKVIDEHRNWHCQHGPGGMTGTGSGKRFIAFHKQYILDYDLWRQFPDQRSWGGTGPGQVNKGQFSVILAWDVNNVTNPASTDYNPMPIGHSACLHGSNRSSGVPCPSCQPLGLQFRDSTVGGTLNNYTSADQLGQDLGAWHLVAYHCAVAATGCQDAGPSSTTPRDPMFWRAHKLLDDVHSSWQKLQAADVVIVLDRSGSMSGSHAGGGTKLQAAKDAIRTFVALFPSGQSNFVGLVSYSSIASDASLNMDLMSAPGVLGDVANPNDGALDIKLNGIPANGGTSMGAGIRQALSMLETRRTLGLANERQAILLLTDGMENTSPCLGGTSCSGEMVEPEEFLVENSSGVHVGDIQLCAVGFGAEGTLDSDLLASLTEREGGIYVAGDVDNVGLKKFFVTCFASLQSGALADDPFGILQPNERESPPVIYSACLGDSRITFVLSWNDSREGLRLAVSTPSLNKVDLGDPAVESVIGPDFHIVRISLPYQGESTDDWTAIATRLESSGLNQRYFISTLVTGPARVEPIAESFRPKTGHPLVPMFRIKQPYWPMGGYDAVDANVFVTRPVEGTGNLLVEQGLGDETVIKGDSIDPRTSTLLLRQTQIPTITEKFPLFDDGTNGDRYANDHYWSVRMPEESSAVDGTYHFRAVFKLTKDGCSFRREAEHTVYVDVGVDPNFSDVDPQPGTVQPDGNLLTPVVIKPFDGIQNFLGPGWGGRPSCEPADECQLDREYPITDNGDGSYTVRVMTVPGVANARLKSFGTLFTVPIECKECPTLKGWEMDADLVPEDTTVIGSLQLNDPTTSVGRNGATIYLESSMPYLVSVPNSVIVPEGTDRFDFPVSVAHRHGGSSGRETVTISATYGDVTLLANLSVLEPALESPTVDITRSRVNDSVVISWWSAPNHVYTVQRTPDLLTQPFTTVISDLPATPPENTYVDFTQNTRRAAYRVQVSAQ